MKYTKYIVPAAVAIIGLPVLSGCNDDEFTETIFPYVVDTVDPGSATYQFDTWLNQNFRDVYNLQFYYKMRDVESDMNYNLVPASYEKARDLALLTKYLWFDSYAELATPEFTKQYGPRIIHLIGSAAHNPSTGTEILGLAEGGLKVSLFKVNSLGVVKTIDDKVASIDMDQLNEFYFRTMHHEFGHILHQTKSYPTEFNLISTGRYDAGNWQDKKPGVVASEGFITAYASSQTREDFAETIANYLTRTDDQDELLLWVAEKGWTDGIEKVEETTKKEDNPEYCYYFFKDKAARDKQERTYLFECLDRPIVLDKATGASGQVCKMGLWVGTQAGTALGSAHPVYSDEFFTNVRDAQQYLDDLNEKLKTAQRDVEAQSLYTKNYADLTATEKTAVDRIVDEMTFIYDVPDTDSANGREIIEQKRNIVRTWFKDVWGLDFDRLRAIVQDRQKKVDPLQNGGRSALDDLIDEVKSIPVPQQ